MPNLLRPQTYPYASSSTGPYRGLLVRKYPCWDARGPARDTFTNEIAGKIKECLEQCLPESNSFVGFSLFMVGKLPEKTKPTVMIVSDDKTRRKAAFQMVKARNILKVYPGFELGHCSVAAEFEDLRQLGLDTDLILESTEDYEDLEYTSDEDGPGKELLSLLSAEVCSFEYPSLEKATQIYFHTSPNMHSHNLASATCGRLFFFLGEYYALTMAHAIRPTRPTVGSQKKGDINSDSSSASDDDFEITGMDDWDENDDGDTKTLTAFTSPGSRTPSELSDSEESLLKRHNSQRSSDVSIQTHLTTTPLIVEEDDYIEDALEDDEELPETCTRLGSVVSLDSELDIAVIQVTEKAARAAGDNTINAVGFKSVLMRCADYDLTDTSIIVHTTHHPEIKGRLSETPFYTRFPGARNFLALLSAQLDTPVRPGDSGSWACDLSGGVVGFVTAGNPKSRSCLLLPAKTALESMHSLLLNRASSTRRKGWEHLRLTGSPPRVVEDVLDDDAVTLASSLPPPSVFSQRLDRGTPSTSGYSASTWYEHKSNTPQFPESLAQGSAEPTGSSVSKSDFFQDEVVRLRRELERVWEIVQEKDTHLQRFITRDSDILSQNLEKSYQAEDVAGILFSLSQGIEQTQGQSSPSKPSYSQASLPSDYSPTASPEAQGPNSGTPQPDSDLLDVLTKVEYYFSMENLAKDRYFRAYMDSQGFIPITVLASFSRIGVSLVQQACLISTVVEAVVGNDGVRRARRREGWERWVILDMNLRHPSARHGGPSRWYSLGPGMPDLGAKLRDGSIESTRTTSDAEKALSRQNQELKEGIKQAIEAIHKAEGSRPDREELSKIASDLGDVLSSSDVGDRGLIPGSTKVKKELEQYETPLKDIPPFPSQTQESQAPKDAQMTFEPQRSTQTPSPQLLAQLAFPLQPRGRRRILTPKSRLNPPLSASNGQGSSLSETGRNIDTVPEEDEDDASGR
ncbi:hypothetical protein F5X98DRAFT_130290 [Xylaria grammica]|nr:hypothetical protein F5X98DRAFT_130290 [Xylaria grammica]